ncbi:MAG: hypothetical protein AAB922_06190, partial [Patescibacteria group bacterium]
GVPEVPPFCSEADKMARTLADLTQKKKEIPTSSLKFCVVLRIVCVILRHFAYEQNGGPTVSSVTGIKS